MPMTHRNRRNDSGRNTRTWMSMQTATTGTQNLLSLHIVGTNCASGEV